jgi:hypothetical protein
MSDIGQAIGAWGATALAGLIWALRLEGRVNGHTQLFDERDRQQMLRDKRADERHADLKADLADIKRKLNV